MTNKKYNKQVTSNYLGFILFTFVILTSCKNNNAVSLSPVIEKVTLYTLPGSNAIVESYPDNLILITGKNLAGATKVTFNGYSAQFSSVYNTESNIIINVPGKAPNAATVDSPSELTNEIVVFTEGGSVATPFKIILPPPTITGVNNEFAPTGAEFHIYGNYLYKIDKIILPDGTANGIEITKDQIVTVTSSDLKITLPVGVKKGNIILENTFGKDTSNFALKDDTYMLMDFDKVKPTGNIKGTYVLDAFGNYYYKNGILDAGFAYRNDIMLRPEFKDKDFSKGYLKFEFKSTNPLLDPSNNCYVRLEFTSFADAKLYGYNGNTQWRPYQMDAYAKTGFHESEWKTIVIPMTKFPGMTTMPAFGRIVLDLVNIPAGQSELSWSFDNVRFSF